MKPADSAENECLNCGERFAMDGPLHVCTKADHRADDVAELSRQMGEAWETYVEANSVRSKALKEYNRLFDLVMLAEMRAKRTAHNDGSVSE